MKKTFRWIDYGVLVIITVVALAACGGQAMPPPVAATNTPLPPAPTEVPTNTPLPRPTDTPQPTPIEAPTSIPPSPTDTPQPVPTEAAEKPPSELVEVANQVYMQNSCAACHGVNHEGGLGPILVGLPAERIQSVTRGGEPEAGMPAFDQDAISDDELSALAEFLSGLTLQEVGITLSPAIVDHLSQASVALQARDKATVEAHLEKAQEAGADASPGVQATLKGLVESLEAADWMESLEIHLGVLLGR